MSWWFEQHQRNYRQVNSFAYRSMVWLTIFFTLLVLGAGIYAKFAMQISAFLDLQYQFRARPTADADNPAWKAAMDAVELDPNNTNACEVLAELAHKAHSPTELKWRLRLANAVPTWQNQVRLANCELAWGPPFRLAPRVVRELSAISATNIACQEVAASLAIKTTNWAEAITHLETILQLDPGRIESRLQLAGIQLNSTNEGVSAQARQTLESLATNTDFSLPALRALSDDRARHSDPAGALVYYHQLWDTGRGTQADYAAYLAFLQTSKSDQFPKELKLAMQRSSTNLDLLISLSDWMRTHQLAAENLQWLNNLSPEIQSLPRIEAALGWAYEAAEDWNGLRSFSSLGTWESLDYLRLAMLYRAYNKLGQSRQADAHWKEAVVRADRNFQSMSNLFVIANQWQMPQEGEKLLQKLAWNFPMDDWARETLAGYYAALGKTKAYRELYAYHFKVFPNPEYLVSMAATELLLKTNSAAGFDWAEEIYANDPQDPHCVAVHAFAMHLRGRDQAALKEFSVLSPEDLQDPTVALYYGIAQAAAGHAEVAAQWLQIPQSKGRLWPEEKVLLAATLQKINASH